MAAIVNRYNIGQITESLEPGNLANHIKSALSENEYRQIWLKNLEAAARELTWENEEKIIQEIFFRFH